VFAASSRPRPKVLVPEDHLIWRRTTVEGRPVVYGVGGSDGPPVVFLHGWALGSHAYKRAIRRLANRGCRVFAPALPSFGDTANLPATSMNITGYAQWVAAFMEAVGINEPALVIGHSFGGGVAIKLAHDNPHLVRYLILLNALGGGSKRFPWEWAIGFGNECWPPTGIIGMIQAMRSDLVPNLVRNPFGIFRVGLLALMTDLRQDLLDLKDLGVPVLVLTSERDRLIPRSAFETVCDAVGAEGRVVSGGHAWLLVDPDSFDQVLASTIDVQVAEHEASRSADRRTEIELLLERSTLTNREIHQLLDVSAPLWLLSESAATLAGDLVLCRPRIKKSEVRALARRIEGSNSYRLTIAARDRPGLLADSAAVLTESGLSISNASASTWLKPKVALHAFIVDSGPEMSAEAWDELGERLREMVATGKAPRPAIGPLRPVIVSAQGVGEQLMVKVIAPDETGLLSMICRFFHIHGLNIETLRARVEDGTAHATMLVVGSVDPVDLKEALVDWLIGSENPQRSLTLVR
jgi:pimeloyl-ACP methyl ester carboxylesterase/glycine cleavage system regulatory protein